MSSDWITSLNQAAFFSGLVVLAGLLWPKNRHISGRSYLIVLMTVICVSLLGNTLKSDWFVAVPSLFLVADVFIFLLGPLVYLSLTSTSAKKSLSHFLPAIIYLLLVLTLTLVSGKDLVGVLSTSGFVTNTATPLVYFLATVQTIVYMELARRYIKRQAIHWKGLPAILVGALLLINIFCLTHFFPYLGFNNPLAVVSTDVIWLVIVLLVFVLNVYFIASGPAAVPTEKTDKSVLLPANTQDIQAGLEQLMQQSRVYHDPELTLNMVSDQLGTTKATLSLVLNAHMQTSFYEYINALRVEDFVAAVNKQAFPNLTHFGVAQKVGFKSKTTFYKSFKAIYQTTPRAYFMENGSSMATAQA